MTLLEKAKKIAEECRIPGCHSDFQIENFIIGKETSIYGKMWQCVREIQARCENLENCESDAEELDDNLSLAQISLRKLELRTVFESSEELQKLQDDRKNILIKKQKRKISKIIKAQSILARKKEEILKEIETFTQIFLKLTENKEYLPYNNTLAQTEYWNNKFDHDLNLAAMFGLPANIELIKSCLALPDDTKVKKQIVGVLNNINKKLLGQNN